MKKFLCFIMMFCLIGVAFAKADEFKSYGRSTILMDNETGNIIYEDNIDEKVNISGLNKLMGTLIVFDEINNGKLKMSDMVQVSESVRKIGGAIAFLEIGKEYAVEELLKSVIVVNANDSMIALCEKISGSEEEFVKRMNEKAKELDLQNTVFTNATGFYDENQYSTARDVAIIGRKVLENNDYVKMSKVYMYEITHPSGNVTELVNTNRLIRTNSSICDGMMSGSNKNENYSVIATGKKGNMRLIAVVLDAKNSDERNKSASGLLNYGFTNFVSKRIYKKNDIIQKDVKIEKGKEPLNIMVESSISTIVERGQDKFIDKEIIINENLTAPINSGDVVGKVVVKLNGNILGQSNLVAGNEVVENGIVRVCKIMLKKWNGTK